MPDTSCFRTPLRNERVHGSKTLVISAWSHFYRNFPLIQDKSELENIFLVSSEILELFGKTLTTDHMNSLHNRVKFLQQLQMTLSTKRKIFSEIFLHFLNQCKSLPILKKKITFIAQIFWKLFTSKNVVLEFQKASFS